VKAAKTELIAAVKWDSYLVGWWVELLVNRLASQRDEQMGQ